MYNLIEDEDEKREKAEMEDDTLSSIISENVYAELNRGIVYHEFNLDSIQ